MTVFKIQTYQTSVSGYENVQTITPDYIWSVTKVWRHWWCPWPRNEIGVITNLRPAEDHALVVALHLARQRRKKERTRLVRVTQLDGKETKTVIWDNGTVLDTTILRWYWRLLRWLILRKPTAKAKQTSSKKKPEKK